MRYDTGSYIDDQYLPFPMGTSLIDDSLPSDNHTTPSAMQTLTTELLQAPSNIIQGITASYETFHTPPTWLMFDRLVAQKTSPIEDFGINVPEALKTIKNLSFLSVNEDIDNEIERYFSSKPLKTKIIFVNKRNNSK